MNLTNNKFLISQNILADLKGPKGKFNLHLWMMYGASMDRGNESMIMKSESHDQDGRHAHIW